MTDQTFHIAELLMLVLFIGGVGGFLSGLLGVGGGILFVPALFYCLGSLGYHSESVMHLAVGTSLAIVMLTGTMSTFQHHKRGAVDFQRVRQWAPYIVAGVVVGSLFAAMVPGEDLKRIFAVLTFLICLYMAFGEDRAEGHGGFVLSQKLQNAIVAVIGAVSSMIGVGGAIMTIPLLSHTGLPIQRAIATGSALGVIIALPGTLSYMLSGVVGGDVLPPWSIGYVNLVAVAAIVPASVLMSPVGVRTAHNFPRPMLRKVFAVVLAIVSIRMFMTL